jgi:hypothetical protein
MKPGVLGVYLGPLAANANLVGGRARRGSRAPEDLAWSCEIGENDAVES